MKTLTQYLTETESLREEPFNRAKLLVDDINTNFGRYCVSASLSPFSSEVIVAKGEDQRIAIKCVADGNFSVDGSIQHQPSRLLNVDEMYEALVGFLHSLGNENIARHLGGLSSGTVV